MSALTFNPGRHTYTLDGKPVPGVTTLLSGGLPKPALTYWSAKQVAEYAVAHLDQLHDMLGTSGPGPTVAFLKAVPWQKRDELAVRGTDVHALGERLVHGEAVEVPEHLAAHVDGYVTWLDAWQPEPLLTERRVFNRRYWYAGTLDLVARIDDQVWLLDLKTTGNVYGDGALQVAAYAHAEWYVDADDVEQPMPSVDRVGIVHVTAEGTNVHEVVNPELAWRDFLHVAWTAKANDRIKNYLTEPLPTPAAERVAS